MLTHILTHINSFIMYLFFWNNVFPTNKSFGYYLQPVNTGESWNVNRHWSNCELDSFSLLHFPPTVNLPLHFALIQEQDPEMNGYTSHICLAESEWQIRSAHSSEPSPPHSKAIVPVVQAMLQRFLSQDIKLSVVWNCMLK